MTYYISKETGLPFEKAVESAVEALKSEGFGVLTDIDVKETLKKKINVDFRNYRILGACHPDFAYKALSVEDKIGLMLPCNVIVQERGEGRVEVAAIDPIQSMQGVGNPSLAPVGEEVRMKLVSVIGKIPSA